MAEKLQYIEELSLKTLKGMNKRENWIGYLKTASNHYKYSFRDGFLIYAQRPDATAVASYDLWNNVMHRYINRGSTGIALVDKREGKPKLHYVFDISDTNGDRIPYIWKLKDDYFHQVNQDIADSFDLDDDSTPFDTTIDNVISSLVEDTMPELLSELQYSKEDSFLEELDDLNLEVMLRDTLKDSIKTMVMHRCGYELHYDITSEFTEFNHLQNFNTNATMLLLGTATSNISETILREIELSVKAIEREARNQERSQQHGNNVQRGGRTDVSGSATQGADRETVNEIRSNEEKLSGEQSSSEVQPNDTRGDTVSTLQGSGDTTQSSDGNADRTDEEADGEQISSDNDIRNRKPVNQGNDNSSLKEQSDIDIVLLRGSGFEGGKQRIIDFYFKESSNTERAKFLKDEYGIGGGSVTFSNNISGFADHNGKGITLRNRYLESEPLHLTWSKAAKRIGQLIENERYYELRYANDKPLIKPTIDTNIVTKGADEAPFSLEENEYHKVFDDNKNIVLDYIKESTNYIAALESLSESDAEEQLEQYFEEYFENTSLKETNPALYNTYNKNSSFQQDMFNYIFDNSYKIHYLRTENEEKQPTQKKKRRTQAEMNYSRLQELAPHIIDKRYRYAKLKSDGYMDLTIEWINDNRIAMAHYGEQNGDLMADPDMELIVDFDKQTLMPAAYQNDYVNVYQQVYLDNNQWNPKLSKELTSFLSTWLRNIEFQRHVIKDAVYYHDDTAIEPIIFDENGKEYGHDIPHDIISSAKLAELQAENKEDTEEIPNTLPDKKQEMQDYGYKWNGMINLDDEVALKLFDKGYSIYLLHEDNTESLAESEKRLIQHINDGGLVGIEREHADFLEMPHEDTVSGASSDEYRDLFEAIIKQGDINKTGKEKIVNLLNESTDMTSFKSDVRNLYGDFWSEIRVDDTPIRWHISPDGLNVFINGFNEPSIKYTWVDISDCIVSLINKDEYFERDEYINTTSKEESSPETNGDKILHAALKQQITILGKQNIINSFNNSANNEEFISQIQAEYGAVGMTFDYDGISRKFKATKTHFVVTPDINEPRINTSYPWHIVADEISKMIHSNTYATRDELQSRLNVGMVVSLEDRSYRITKIDFMYDKIEMDDLTFQQGTGFPIGRTETLSGFEKLLEEDGFFHSQEVELKRQLEEETPIQESETSENLQAEKINFHITDNNLGIGGPKEKYQKNIAAIKLLKQIESESRLATSDEQEILSQYVGWGGLSKAFDENDSSWSNEYVELKNISDEDEYKAARSSVLTAYYTSPIVIKSVYKALENMGFNGGNVLEPAMGIGNFMGLLPPSLSDSKMYGVELDSISGRIAKQLYQRESIQITGLEHTAFHDNFFDVAIGNVPFGAYGVVDKKYDKHNFQIHDYFFAKALDKIRPGGVVAFITSKGTLDKKNSSVRKYLAQRAELVGAIRLPNNAFKSNAGTEVTSDIIFLKKRDSLQDIEPDWVQLGRNENGYDINQYFVDNPHMVLGELKEEHGLYGALDITCVPYDDIPLVNQLSKAISNIQAEIDEIEYMIDEPDIEDTSIPADPNVKNYSFTIVDEKLYYRENSRMNAVEVNATAEKRIKAMLGLSKTLHTLIDYQLDGYAPHSIKDIQLRLNTMYDAFIKDFGRINDRANRLAFSDDSSYYLLSSLENFDENGKFESKADIFTKQTIRPNKIIDKVDTSTEALAVSIGRKAKVDIGFMSSLTGKEPDTIIEELKGVIFKDPLSDLDNPYEGYLTADEYLSGNVRDKLKTAKLMAKNNDEFVHHVPALEAVQPKDLEAGDIEVRLGTVWIPPRYIDEFMYELLDTSYYGKDSIETSYSKHSGSWNISNKSYDSYNVMARETYGTERINAYQIIEDTLNQKNVRITDKVIHPDGREEYVLNKDETLLATQKQNIIKEAFKDWVFKDERRRKYLVDYYNENYNNIRPREYNGEHIEFVGMNPEITLHPHQRNAVARQLYGGNSLLAHVVGAGKTYTMVAAAMESKRLGLCNKSMIAVPNHLTQQLASETLKLYPSAKVLVTTKKDFQKHNRKRFCSKIATGDYDVIIIGHSQFEKVPLSQERQIRMITKEIDDITYAINNTSWSERRSYNVKQMEKTKKSLEKRLEKLNDQTRKDDVVTFEELGVDRLFVDEAHSYKNLFVYTKMRNVAGIQQTQAQKSMDMYMKCKYLDEITGGKGITFATGTPISNSMVEMFTMQRYLQMHELVKRDLHHFDNWASVFGETQTAYELAPEGNKFRIKTRFNKFHNLPELMAVFKEVADIQTNDMLNLPIPKLKDGKVINISVPATDLQRKMIEELGDRAELVRKKEVEPNEDNMLMITNDGRKIALDQRLANPCYPDDPNSKINTLMNNVYDIWERETDIKGAQIVFCDLSTPKFDGSFNVYEDLRKKWVEKGIPEEQIAFIHEAKNEKQKAAMFAKVRSGEIRIILGSTFMMGSGVNIQERLKAVHHADVGWKPSSMEQRNGRILRQGNSYDEIEIYRYITESTFDGYSWQLLEQKQRFISQIMTSKAPVRSADDIDEAVLSYAEVKALATGNPKIKERMELDVEVSRLKLLKTAHRNQLYRLQDQISTRLPEKIRNLELRINGYEADCKAAAFFNDTDFSMTLNKAVFAEKKDAGEMLLSISKKAHALNGKIIGTYKGFEMTINADSLFKTEPYIELKGTITHRIDLGSDALGNITRLDNAIKGFEERREYLTHDLDSAKTQLESAKNEVDKPFPQDFELRQKTARLEELNQELSMDKSDDTQELSSETEQETKVVGLER